MCASFAGAPKNPAWFNNLSADPEVTVQVPGKTMACRAIITEGDEREKLWARPTASFKGYQDHI